MPSVEYDICIIGAGIAGLYCARELKRKHPKAKICLLEKYKGIGGRTYTFHTKVNGLDISWEAGAGRIHKSHHQVLNLLNEYDIETIPIGNKIEWRTINTPGVAEPIDFLRLFENLGISQLSEESLESMTIKQILQKTMGDNKTQDLIDRYEYRSELDTLKASNALYSLNHELGNHGGFCVIKGGFSVLIGKMKADISGVKLLLEHEVTDIQKLETYEISVKSRETIRAKKVIVAIPRDALAALPCFRGLPILEQVKMRPLVRMYAVFPLGPDGKAWFAGLEKFVCDLPIRYVIPIDPTKGTIMISYTDGPEAEQWIAKARKSEAAVQKEVMAQICSLFPAQKIPDPLFFKIHPWSDGCSYWAPVANKPYDFNLASKASVKPLPDMPELYMCNESWAYAQAWVKCSLDQAQKVIDIIE
jgi:monoamine oxidase